MLPTSWTDEPGWVTDGAAAVGELVTVTVDGGDAFDDGSFEGAGVGVLYDQPPIPPMPEYMSGPEADDAEASLSYDIPDA